MAVTLTVSTVENTTTIVTAGTGTTAAPVVIFQPSPAEIGRYRLRVVRVVYQGCTGGDSVLVQGITPTASGTETQSLFLSPCPLNAAAAAVVVAATDTVSFPDEHEFRGKIQCSATITTGVATIFLHHG